MFRYINIESYRGLSHVVLEELNRVNIIVGDNNSGKTSILEAIQLFGSRDVLNNMISIAKRRTVQNGLLVKNQLSSFDELLYSFPACRSEYKEICLEMYDDEGEQTRVQIDGNLSREYFYKEELPGNEQIRFDMYCDEDGAIRSFQGGYSFDNGCLTEGEYQFRETQLRPIRKLENKCVKKSMSVVCVSPLDMYTNRIINDTIYKGMKSEEKKSLIELLQLFDDSLIGVEVGIRYGKPTILVEMKGRGLMPVSVFGDGLKKVLTLANAVSKAEHGILLIDEFETGLHKSVLAKVAEWLFTMAERHDVQVFLTTHSGDAVDALVRVQNRTNVEIGAYRLEHYLGNTFVKNFSSKELSELVGKQGMDIL